MSPFKYSISLLLLTLSTLGSTIQAQELDLVLLGGRVMDPETGLDAIRNVGIADGTVAIITEDDIRGPGSHRECRFHGSVRAHRAHEQ